MKIYAMQTDPWGKTKGTTFVTWFYPSLKEASDASRESEVDNALVASITLTYPEDVAGILNYFGDMDRDLHYENNLQYSWVVTKARGTLKGHRVTT